MKHTYNVSGMTCNGCKSSVEESLSVLPNIENISVNLEAKEAIISMKTHLDLKTLQNVLSDKFKISEKIEANSFNSTETKSQSELKQLFPLFLIISYLIIAALLLNRNPWDTSGFMLDFMGLFYIVFSFFKLLDLKGFSNSFKMYDPLTKAIPAYGWVYPFIEVALGLMFLFRFQTDIALIVTLIVLGITTFGVTKTLLNKKSIQCACLGTALKLPMTKATFIENTIMITMAIIMLFKTMSL
ncbi:heavy metal translocating P-type ATPase [Winogradskyella sp. UBA3174]|uniref:heavy metal translocating P-type ATPase n=1 Tax=Winogradskyella sp. UBA3174 TaxID=1947785 RepID=UPI0025E9D373|nr:MauE/DoxX family redox-associated membrane protein [Winogradskyella sp. UBA3174]|tara:strand:+ start:76094 stop:76819 length:726 start_codon:yes stop_codon:yes gene_type:complete